MNPYTLNGSKDEPIIGFTQKSQRTSQHGTNNAKICNLTTLNSMDPTNLIFVSRGKIYLVGRRQCSSLNVKWLVPIRFSFYL